MTSLNDTFRGAVTRLSDVGKLALRRLDSADGEGVVPRSSPTSGRSGHCLRKAPVSAARKLQMASPARASVFDISARARPGRYVMLGYAHAPRDPDSRRFTGEEGATLWPSRHQGQGQGTEQQPGAQHKATP